MLTALFLSYLAVILVGFIHYLLMAHINAALRRWLPEPNYRMPVLLSVIFAVHLFEAGIFAVTFVIGQNAGLGDFKSDAPLSSMSIFYFSIVNYTTLGLGDIYPGGHLRVMAGIEAFIGFLLLSCSAAMLFNVVTEKQSRLTGSDRA